MYIYIGMMKLVSYLIFFLPVKILLLLPTSIQLVVISTLTLMELHRGSTVPMQSVLHQLEGSPTVNVGSKKVVKVSVPAVVTVVLVVWKIFLRVEVQQICSVTNYLRR